MNPAWRIKGRTSDGPARQETRLVFDMEARKETGSVVLQIDGRERQVNVSEVDGTDAVANKKKMRNGDVPSSSVQLNGPVDELSWASWRASKARRDGSSRVRFGQSNTRALECRSACVRSLEPKEWRLETD